MRPYLIIPQLIEQPTWGGSYIAKMKNWQNANELIGKKIGQSYELTGTSYLSLLDDSASIDFLKQTVTKNPENALPISQIIPEMPLLIKINQAAGNSFQLHVKPGTTHPRWKPKPESWFFLEPGYISCGIKPDISIGEYKKTCDEIDNKMKELSAAVIKKEKTLENAQQEAKTFIKEKNPWKFVNLYEMQKNDVIDLSEGGVHHSWEENKEQFPLGNIVYEVQLDVMDPECTIRSFDQGKIKEDGTVREIHINDYFQFLDTNPAKNDINNLRRTRDGEHLIHTSYYSLDVLEVSGSKQMITGNSFHHLYVQEGDVEIRSREIIIHVSQGHSCLIPQSVSDYSISSRTQQSVLLKTFI